MPCKVTHNRHTVIDTLERIRNCFSCMRKNRIVAVSAHPTHPICERKKRKGGTDINVGMLGMDKINSQLTIIPRLNRCQLSPMILQQTCQLEQEGASSSRRYSAPWTIEGRSGCLYCDVHIFRTCGMDLGNFSLITLSWKSVIVGYVSRWVDVLRAKCCHTLARLRGNEVIVNE